MVLVVREWHRELLRTTALILFLALLLQSVVGVVVAMQGDLRDLLTGAQVVLEVAQVQMEVLLVHRVPGQQGRVTPVAVRVCQMTSLIETVLGVVVRVK